MPLFLGIVVSILSADLLDKIAENKKAKENTEFIDNVIETIIIPEFTLNIRVAMLSYAIHRHKQNLPIETGYDTNKFISTAFDEIKFKMINYKNDNNMIEKKFTVYVLFNKIGVSKNWNILNAEEIAKLFEACEKIMKRYKVEMPDDTY